VITLGLVLVLVPVVLSAYSLVLYPLLLKLIGLTRAAPPPATDPMEWPTITITIPAHNEAASIAGTLEGLLALDYPADRREILVISDASTDGTDEIVRGFADRGVELLRLPVRSGKTAAENAAATRLRGEIIVNTDATIRIPPDALKPLIRVFNDPTIGVASGRDVSVGDRAAESNRGESGYVDYEMWVRDLETRLGSIVGASGCLYAIRRDIHDTLFPSALSRDFATALIAKTYGLRAVSVPEAICQVPRAKSLRAEYRRKTRTMARGLETLWYKRSLLNPARYGLFAWKLASHKLARWLAFLSAPGALIGLGMLSGRYPLAAWLLALAAIGAALGLLAIVWPGGKPPRLLSVFGFALVSAAAGFIAWTKALRGELNPVWEPTRRSSAT
jgi:cellulose synthase/poly-beta-1,6-N-acetylglucosamine synthase-like glycosyltransferase